MPTVNFMKPDGSAHTISVDEGTTLMEAGRDNNMGTEGTCGGSLSWRLSCYFQQGRLCKGWRTLR